MKMKIRVILAVTLLVWLAFTAFTEWDEKSSLWETVCDGTGSRVICSYPGVNVSRLVYDSRYLGAASGRLTLVTSDGTLYDSGPDKATYMLGSVAATVRSSDQRILHVEADLIIWYDGDSRVHWELRRGTLR